MEMKKNFLNIALLVTALAAVVTLIIFFIKLDSVSKDATGANDSSGKTTSNADKSTSETSDKDSSGSGSGKSAPEGEKVVLVSPTPTPSPSPSPTPSPTPSPSPTPEPFDVSNLDPNKPIVALSFDDGPSSNTESILATLEKYGAHATFFMVGENIDMYPERVKMVYESGCEVANHTVNHANLNKLSAEEIKKEISNNQDKLNKTLGLSRDYLVRPPYGNANDTVKANAGHPLINWSVDTLDWQSRDPDAVMEIVKRDTRNGSIILMHDLYSSTAEAVKKVVPWLVEQGYQICSVSEMFAAKGITLENGKVYNSVK